MHEIIKPGTRYAIVQHSKTMLFISTMLILGCVLLLVINGLNLGIDFLGGNKLILAFEQDANVSRDDIRSVVRDVLSDGNPDSQVEVQDFESPDEKTRYQIFVETTTMLSDEQAADIQKSLKTGLAANKGTETERVSRPQEQDKFVVLLKQGAPIQSTKTLLRQIISNPRCCDSRGACTPVTDANKVTIDTAAGTCTIGEDKTPRIYTVDYPQLEISSDEERNLAMEFYKEYNLRVVEFQKEGQELADDDFKQERAKHDLRVGAILETRLDKSFTVSLQQFQNKMQAALQDRFGKDIVTVESATSVSASVGKDLFNKGMVAILYAIIGILIYIGFRFDFRYSPGAVAALIHDTMITLGLFSLFGIKFTLPIIAALLTIIGYSLNDTIVVYDRIRENLQKFKGMDLSKLVNQSINETLSRTVLTSLTTLFVVVSLLVWGGGLIKDFALALTIGVIVGTYSSVFIASPLVIIFDKYIGDGQEKSSEVARTPQASKG
jgi:preprotein translocase SecF subunit